MLGHTASCTVNCPVPSKELCSRGYGHAVGNGVSELSKVRRTGKESSPGDACVRHEAMKWGFC